MDGAEGTAQRNATLETIRNVGRQGWQQESGYRRQGAGENLVFRYKRTLGNSLRARGYESQKTGDKDNDRRGVSWAADRIRACPELIHAPTPNGFRIDSVHKKRSMLEATLSACDHTIQ